MNVARLDSGTPPTFTGSYERAVDAKGRLSLPFRFRREGGDEELYYVTPGLDGALTVFPLQEWERVIAELQARGKGREGRARLRRFSAHSYRLVPDGQGRVSVPVELLEKVGITRRVLVVGMGRYMELWAPERFPESIAVTEDPEDEAFLDDVF